MFVDNVMLHKAPLGKGTSLLVFGTVSATIPIIQIEYHNAFPNILFAASQNEVRTSCLFQILLAFILKRF